MEIIRPRQVELADDKSDQICLKEETLLLPRNGFLYVGHIIVNTLYMYMSFTRIQYQHLQFVR